MAKYTQKLVDSIIRYIEQDLYTIDEICKISRINRKTFYEWKNTKPEFRQAVEEASERCDDMLVAAARISLKQKIEGYTITEENITYEPSKSNPSIEIEKSRVVKKKQCPPDLQAIKYVLERHEKKREKESSPSLRPLEIHVPDQQTADNLIKLYDKEPQKAEEQKPEKVSDIENSPAGQKDRRSMRQKEKDRKIVRYENGQEITYDPVTKITVIKGSSCKILPPGYTR